MKNHANSFFRRTAPLWLGFIFVVLIVVAHLVAVDVGARQFSDEELKALPTVNRAIDKLKAVNEEDPQEESADSIESSFGFLRPLRMILDFTGLRQNWRIANAPAPEIQGFEIRAYHKSIKAMTGVYRTVFALCAELDNTGECAPEIRSHIELEMLKSIERTKSPALIEAFTSYVIERAQKTFDEEYRKVEFIAYRHALKTTRDYSKRANTQILLTKELL